jgi:hypothetical protein
MATRQVKLHEVYQARITVTLNGRRRSLWGVLRGKPKNIITINYDSQLVFPTQELATNFVPYYVREVIEIGLLSIDQKYEAGVLQLHVFDGAVDIEGE